MRLTPLKDSIFDPIMDKLADAALIGDHALGQFRCSGFPYCPIVDYLDQEEAQENDEQYALDDFKMAFYTTIGTAVHENLQRFIPHASPKRIWGDWEDPKGNVYEKCTFKQARDQSGKKHLRYREIGLNYKGLTGHIDVAVKKQHLHLGDWKTTNLNVVKHKNTRDYYPYRKHVIQLKNYAALMQMQFGMWVDTYTVMYVSRNKVEGDAHNAHKHAWDYRSFAFKHTEQEYEETRQRIETAIKGRNLVMKAREKGLTQIRADKLFELRTCHSRSDYYDYMSASFFDCDCDHVEKCTRGRMPRPFRELIEG